MIVQNILNNLDILAIIGFSTKTDNYLTINNQS
jgi:hypothetical protein